MFSKPSHQYINHLYPSDHWALDNAKEGTCLAFIKFRDKQNYAIKLNPTDRRGYRALITFVGEDKTDIQTTFNRSYTAAEQRGLSDVTACMIEVFKRTGLPIVQTAQAGNNSQSLSEDGVTQIGNQKEPSMLHTHIWGRGNPTLEYIPGVPLDGPKPGEMFDMMAKTPSVPGNQKKVSWEPKQLEAGLQAFKKVISDYINSSEFNNEFGNTLDIAIYQPLQLQTAQTSKSGIFSGSKQTSTPIQSNDNRLSELLLEIKAIDIVYDFTTLEHKLKAKYPSEFSSNDLFHIGSALMDRYDQLIKEHPAIIIPQGGLIYSILKLAAMLGNERAFTIATDSCIAVNQYELAGKIISEESNKFSVR